MKTVVRRLVGDARKHGLHTAWMNLRFELGWRIGGFTRATR